MSKINDIITYYQNSKNKAEVRFDILPIIFRVFACQLAVRFLYLIITGIPAYAQDAVRIFHVSLLHIFSFLIWVQLPEKTAFCTNGSPK